MSVLAESISVPVPRFVGMADWPAERRSASPRTSLASCAAAVSPGRSLERYRLSPTPLTPPVAGGGPGSGYTSGGRK